MRILFVTPYYNPQIVGGAEISVQILAEGLAARNHSVSVLTLDQTDHNEVCNGVEVYRFYNPGMFKVWKSILDGRNPSLPIKIVGNIRSNTYHHKVACRYMRFFNEHKFEIIILNSNENCFEQVSLWEAIKKMRISTIMTFRDPYLMEKRFLGVNLDKVYQKFVQKRINWVRAYAAPSEYMLKQYETNGFLLKEKRVIYNAVKVKKNCDVQKSREKKFLFAGSITEKKGIKTLINAIEILQRKVGTETFEMLLVGKGDMADSARGIQGINVIDWMPQENLYSLMQSVLAVILPSEWPEAFGRILIEGVFHGALPVGSSAGAIPEIFDYDDRYIFRAGDANALAKRLERILNLSVDQYEEEIKIIQKKCEIYSYDNYVINWEKYMKKVIKM